MSKISDYKPEDLAEYFEYLDGLRESGVTSMWGAGPFIEKEKHVDKDAASKILGAWMDTFSDDEPLERAAQAIGAEMP